MCPHGMGIDQGYPCARMTKKVREVQMLMLAHHRLLACCKGFAAKVAGRASIAVSRRLRDMLLVHLALQVRAAAICE